MAFAASGAVVWLPKASANTLEPCTSSFCVSEVVAPLTVLLRLAVGAASGETVQTITGIALPSAAPVKPTVHLPLA